jgi:hypothetical protein
VCFLKPDGGRKVGRKEGRKEGRKGKNALM